MTLFKVEYHANENPLKISEKNNIYICWSNVNVSNNQKNQIYLTTLVKKKNAITFLGFYIRNEIVVFN